jgi:hypothetical protein
MEFNGMENTGAERERDREGCTGRAESFESSEKLDKIFTALSKAQGEMSAAKKGAVNPFFKSNYADLASCYEACRPALVANGLSIMHLPMGEHPNVRVKTVLAHSSGQWILCTVVVKPMKVDPQGTGSAITYAKRYGLVAIVALPESDDDGNAASTPNYHAQRQETGGYTSQGDQRKVTDNQLKRLFAIAKANEWEDVHVKDELMKLGLESSKDLTREQYDRLIRIIEG